ncbi:MAG: hypothetical protein CO127_04790 [Ignavibacteria bacterium CG_4_9_14_3_um_filter_36_18]|nr:MAG: hypothetical protein CO127_04790 [Ignavibacteria bacterium CG_4_9_14_3_um_filter_36_18]
MIYFLRTHYIHPLEGGRIFQIGYNMSLKNLRLNNSYHYIKGNGYIEDLAQKNNRKYDQQNHDIYSSYNDKLWGLSYDISSKLTGMYRENLNEVLNKKYNYKYWGIFPAISIKREIFKGQRINLGWSTGVFYPDNNQINPYIDNSDSANIFKGNPDLTPEKNFSYGIGYSYINNNFNLIGGVGVWETRDIIQRYTYLENQKTSITSYKNIGKNRNYNGYVSVEKPLFDWWRLTLNLSAYKIEYSDAEYQHKAFAWGGRIQSRIHLSNFTLQMNFSYSSPTITSQQNKKKETYYFDIGSKVSLFEKRLFLYLKVKDLFNSLRNNSNTYGTGFISATTMRETTRIFYIGLIFYFQDSEAPEEQIRETETTDF